MEWFELQRIARNDDYEILVHRAKNFMLMSYIGIWDETSQLNYYLEDVQNALKNLKSGFNLIIDLLQYRGSKSEYVQLHIEAQNAAIKAGLDKTAVVISNNPMLKVTVEYIFKQSNLRAVFFNSMPPAEQYISIK